MKISVSFLKNKLGNMKTVQLIDKTSADLIHVDIMDGKFVTNQNFPDNYDYLKKTNKPLDIHLMMTNPLRDLDYFIELKPKIISVQIEAEDISECLKKIKENNIIPGLAISPDTPIDTLKKYENLYELVLLLSVYPGQGGQQFLESSILKLNTLQKLNKNILITVDGGINDKTIKLIDCDIAVSGSFICMSDDYEKQIEKLRK